MLKLGWSRTEPNWVIQWESCRAVCEWVGVALFWENACLIWWRLGLTRRPQSGTRCLRSSRAVGCAERRLGLTRWLQSGARCLRSSPAVGCAERRLGLTRRPQSGARCLRSSLAVGCAERPRVPLAAFLQRLCSVRLPARAAVREGFFPLLWFGRFWPRGDLVRGSYCKRTWCRFGLLRRGGTAPALLASDPGPELSLRAGDACRMGRLQVRALEQALVGSLPGPVAGCGGPPSSLPSSW